MQSISDQIFFISIQFFTITVKLNFHTFLISKQGASFYQTSERGPFGDALEEMDDSIGKMIAYLDQAGIRDNTVIVFSSDNG